MWPVFLIRHLQDILLLVLEEFHKVQIKFMPLLLSFLHLAIWLYTCKFHTANILQQSCPLMLKLIDCTDALLNCCSAHGVYSNLLSEHLHMWLWWFALLILFINFQLQSCYPTLFILHLPVLCLWVACSFVLIWMYSRLINSNIKSGFLGENSRNI